MIDLHSHFLPGIDDGAKDVSESIAMLKEAYSQGVRISAATPHAVIHTNSAIAEFAEKRCTAHGLLLEEIARAGAEKEVPKIILGAEVYLDNDINQYEDLKLLCIGETNRILMEFPMNESYDKRAEEWIYSLICRGFQPVIAHVERYRFCMELLEALDGLDVIYQVNASIFGTMHGRRLMKKIVKSAQRCVVSSDMHNTSSRKCNMRPAYERSLKMFGEETYELFGGSAESVCGEEI